MTKRMNERPKPRGAITAGELMDRLEKDAEYQRRMEEKRAEHEKRVAELKRILAPVMGDLQAAGYDFDSIGKLRRARMKYEAALPILLYWLPRVPTAQAKLVLVNSLAVPWASAEAAPLLLEEFDKTPKEEQQLRWEIGNVIEAMARPVLLDKILQIVTDKTNGKAREMFVLALAKIPHPQTVQALIGLLEDEQVAGHAIMALRRLKAPEALDHLAKFSDHPQTWIRNEAKKAVTTIIKSRTKLDKG